MSDEIIISKVTTGRARVTLSSATGSRSTAVPMISERKRVLIKGYTLNDGGTCEIRDSDGILIALPVIDGSTPLVSLTLGDGEKQIHLVVDIAGLTTIMAHLLEALKMVTSEMEGNSK